VLRSALIIQTCGSGVSNCPAIRAIVARDVDGDHKLDLIAIDASLAVYIWRTNGPAITIAAPSILPTGNFKVVRTSVTGTAR
jgi:hypothetical protein